jgi:hypothetical protein
MKAADPSKEDMLAMIQCRNPGHKPDAWFGNLSIDPSAGKRSVPPPFDPKGRKDLFGVLNQGKPAPPPACDAWMGNQMIDPARGRRSCPGPEQRRKNLFPIIQHVRHPMHCGVSSFVGSTLVSCMQQMP